MRPIALCVALAVAACSSTQIVHELRASETALLLPELLLPGEPPADRVLVLLASGRTMAFEDAVVSRRDGRLVVARRAGAVVLAQWPIEATRAVQLERHAATVRTVRTTRDEAGTTTVKP